MVEPHGDSGSSISLGRPVDAGRLRGARLVRPHRAPASRRPPYLLVVRVALLVHHLRPVAQHRRLGLLRAPSCAIAPIRSKGLSAPQVAVLVALCSFTFALGTILLAGLVLTIEPELFARLPDEIPDVLTGRDDGPRHRPCPAGPRGPLRARLAPAFPAAGHPQLPYRVSAPGRDGAPARRRAARTARGRRHHLFRPAGDGQPGLHRRAGGLPRLVLGRARQPRPRRPRRVRARLRGHHARRAEGGGARRPDHLQGVLPPHPVRAGHHRWCCCSSGRGWRRPGGTGRPRRASRRCPRPCTCRPRRRRPLPSRPQRPCRRPATRRRNASISEAMRARLRRLAFAAATLFGLPRGFFIPYRYAALRRPEPTIRRCGPCSRRPSRVSRRSSRRSRPIGAIF